MYLIHLGFVVNVMIFFTTTSFSPIPLANSSFILSASAYLNTRPIPPICPIESYPIESYPINQTSKGKDLIQDNHLPNRTVNTLLCHQAFLKCLGIKLLDQLIMAVD